MLEWNTFFGILIGGAITIVTAICIERIRKPKIRMEIADPIDSTYQGKAAQSARWLRVNIGNHPLPWIFRWMLRNPAERGIAKIAFHHLDGQSVFSSSMKARWESSPEPVNQIAYLFWSVFRVEIHPGEKEILNVAAKFDQDLNCFGWCDENYHSQSMWKNPKWQIPPGRYLVQIIVRSGGETAKRVFRLMNDLPGLQEFRLTTALSGDRIPP